MEVTHTLAHFSMFLTLNLFYDVSDFLVFLEISRHIRFYHDLT